MDKRDTSVTIKYIYTDNTIQYETFKTKSDAEWFIHNEGDHIKFWEYVGWAYP